MTDAVKPSRNLPAWLLTVLIGRRPTRTLIRLAVLIIGTWVLFTFVLSRPVRVTGISMQPTYMNGQINFINRLAYLRHEPVRGDVVGVHFKRTEGTSFLYLKRIVALPGETLAFENGRLYVNGELIPEPYVKSACDWNMSPRKLGYDEYYVVGDNRGMPQEDHDQGAVSRRQIVGRILLRGNS